MRGGQEFSRLIEEFGVAEKESRQASKDSEGLTDKDDKAATKEESVDSPKKARAQLMQDEERNKGAVPLSTYAKYVKYAGGVFWAPVIILLLALSEGASGAFLY